MTPGSARAQPALVQELQRVLESGVPGGKCPSPGRTYDAERDAFRRQPKIRIVCPQRQPVFHP
jgi:hypothetical protein